MKKDESCWDSGVSSVLKKFERANHRNSSLDVKMKKLDEAIEEAEEIQKHFECDDPNWERLQGMLDVLDWIVETEGEYNMHLLFEPFIPLIERSPTQEQDYELGM